MELKDLFKKLQSIKPDTHYTRTSRQQILHTHMPRKRVTLSVWRFAARGLQAGSAVVLAGILLLLILGGLPGSPFTHVRFPGPAALDLEGLKAEAEAIDIQIKISNLDADLPLLSIPTKEKAENQTTTQAANPQYIPKIKRFVAPEATSMPAKIKEPESLDAVLGILKQ